MNERENNPDTPNNTTTAPRPWIEPTFERVTLTEAQIGNTGPTADGLYTNS